MAVLHVFLVFLVSSVIINGQPLDDSDNDGKFFDVGIFNIDIGNMTNIDGEPVTVTLFFEALCPFCSKFIRGQLYPAWKKLHKTGILKVKMVAYGNAREYKSGDRWVYRCQHGSRECQLNLLETCAFDVLNDEQKMVFIDCLEYYKSSNAAKYCVQLAKGDYTEVYTCATTKRGNDLQHAAKEIQSALNPRLRFVPWILVNGYHDDGIQGSVQKNMIAYVCNAYQGTKPSECYGYLDDDEE